MKNIIFIFVLLVANAVGFFVWADSAQAESSCDNHVVISQIYGGGGNSGAIYKNDFIELYNPTTENISVNNWSVQYVSATGNFPTTSSKITLLQGNIKSKSYYLIQEYSASNAGQFLENPDAFGLINFAADKGKVALVNGTALINSESDSPVADFMIYSSGSNAASVYRKMDSCPNTFSADVPTPRNSSIIESIEEEPQGNNDAAQNESENNDTSNQDSPEKCAASSKDIKLNEIFPYPASGGEFVEVINIGESCANISGWKIMDEAEHKKEFPANSIINQGEYLALEGNLYLNNDSDTVYLLDKNGNTKNDAFDYRSYEKSQKDFSYIFNGKDWSWTSFPTPEKENVIATDDAGEKIDDTNSAENISSNEKVYLNEILPNPKDESDDEYIEIANGESGPVDLFGWRLKDGSKSKGYPFKEHIVLNPGEYFAIYRSDSKIALNNSDESLNLYNPQGEVVSSVSFEKSQKNASYGFDGKGWRWSKYLTPGKKNKFDSEPSVKIKKPKSVFKDIFTEFSAKAKDKETKKLKYAWDFGDGKKSYLAKTSHKYLATGKYTVTLSVSDDSQTVKKNFVLAVKNYLRPDLEIVKIIPNPVGNDSNGETIDINNNSGKKIDLAGWKIATGSGEKLYNHPISGEISLERNGTKTITREFSKFSLNNKVGKVQLASPDGKIIDEVEYTKEKISEGEVYVKTDGEWQWSSPDEKSAQGGSASGGKNTDDNEDNVINKAEGEVLGETDEKRPYYAPLQAGYTSEDAFIFFKLFGLLEYKPREADFCPANETFSSLAYL